MNAGSSNQFRANQLLTGQFNTKLGNVKTEIKSTIKNARTRIKEDMDKIIGEMNQCHNTWISQIKAQVETIDGDLNNFELKKIEEL